MAELLAKAAAVGVWLFGPKGDVISGAVKDPSIKPPKNLMVEGVTYFEFGEWQIYAEPIGNTKTTLVMLFGNHPSFGLITLCVRKAEEPIKQALYCGAGAGDPDRG